MPRYQILAQYLSHQVHLEEGGQEFVMKLASENKAFVSSLVSNQFGTSSQCLILLLNPPLRDI